MKKINEIFYSLQGEGYYTGTPAVFVRFSGCNLNCDFCDTEHLSGVFMSDNEILTEITQYPTRHIVLTGGEPTLQIDVPFMQMLKEDNWYIQIETNGTLTSGLSIADRWAVWVTCSPKKDCIREKANELKVVYTGQDMSQYDSFICDIRSLQPCSMLNTQEVIDYIKKHPQWRLSLQTHKMLDIR